MAAEEPVRVALVVANLDALDATAARVSAQFQAERSVFRVLSPSRSVSRRAVARLTERGWEVTGEMVAPFSDAAVADAVGAAGVDHVVVGPDLPFAPSALRARLADAGVDVSAPPASSRPHGRLWRPTGASQRATLFALALGFYLLLGQVTAFDLVTGVASAVVVVLLLSHVSFTRAPTLSRTLPRVARAVLFVPYLVWEILRANLALAVVLLHPQLPIDPSVEHVETDADSDLERAVLANSVTLTPGTLTVHVRDSSLVVHTLTGSSRAGLYERSLERAVGFVFYGRKDGRNRERER